MISVDEALAQVLALLSPTDIETIEIRDATARVLAHPVSAKRDQPPFASSAMDGYAVKSGELDPYAQLLVIGESAAGHRFDGAIKAGQCVRIFTGAPVPEGADRILIQEDCTRSGNVITVNPDIDTAHYIRPAGGDFRAGSTIDAPTPLTPSNIALIAAMNVNELPVYRKPVIALVATGDELVHPSETPNQDQIISSNNFGLKALIESHGASARLLPIARDDMDSLTTVLDLCEGADLIVTLGGASVGDHDLMGKMAADGTLDTEFYKVAMRPGKPLMAGLYKGTPLIGLPGNPVSALVCGYVFLIPAIRAMLGLPRAALATQTATLGIDLPANGPRSHYMRAHCEIIDGQNICTPFERQDSSLLSVMTAANAFMIRPPNQSSLSAGDTVQIVPL
ncbi:molybdopterin molybdenumtransferase MoeA [Amylibacter ulvae]|uniref:Molybdopterin molybdenumtransferase n=1 Tax=Paramylibacter ulvae TaxID=1651968 RepID=A0ABQ3CXL4_9RHOB|nr:gephyrin-like molybdotransferase Glp [Amylibacter ulvae]GHA41028.1 molybdopterin molybdenumtransferase MoeA [Amylibacter ulvae]